MRLWPFGRRREQERLDQTGPATSYPDLRGCYAPGAAPVEHEAAWNTPTLIDGHASLLTPGQRRQYRVHDYREDESGRYRRRDGWR